MTNLIPPAAKKELVHLYRLRLLSAWALLWSVSLLVGASLLYPTYLLITGTSAAYAETAGAVTERTQAYDVMVAELNRTTSESREIVRASKETLLSNLLEDILSVSGQGVEVDTIDLMRSEEGLFPIGLTGEAFDRQALASFRDRIEALPYVEEVILPIGNLAGNQDINFNITVVTNLVSI